MNNPRTSASPPRRPTPRTKRRIAAAACATGALLGTLTSTPTAHAAPDRPAPTTCPADLTHTATCYSGQDTNGAHYTIALPHTWNGSLVVHAHGGPDLNATPDPQRSADDLNRWSVMVKEGYAWAGSSYRRGGFGTRMAAQDTENVRRLFVKKFAQPKRTYVHGQSWGGNVAAKVVEKYAPTQGPYDGALLTNGVLAGASRGYDYRVDLRTVYQYYCNNHPRPNEPQYPVWQGLRADSTMTTTGLRTRLQECTGYASPPQNRTPLQQRNLDDILAVTKIPERTLESHLSFATFTFRDIVHHRLGGRNPFTNKGVTYSGSHDDKALNAGIQRFTADPTAKRDLSYDSDLTGKIAIPVLTMHAIDDPTAFVQHETAYRATLKGAHRSRHLVQTFTRESDHSELSDAEYATSITALDTWTRTGKKPTPRTIAHSCTAFDRIYSTGCFYAPHYHPSTFASRINPRPGGLRWPAMTATQEKTWSHINDIGITP
ncbi:hypothetical protein [Streptomyces sp. NPDC002564]|uniref:hypothetical protein n=1 Tax=Streptomyces sp. NPDC002564 TaxID=3364649 RepID=UPI00369F0C40